MRACLVCVLVLSLVAVPGAASALVFGAAEADPYDERFAQTPSILVPGASLGMTGYSWFDDWPASEERLLLWPNPSPPTVIGRGQDLWAQMASVDATAPAYAISAQWRAAWRPGKLYKEPWYVALLGAYGQNVGTGSYVTSVHPGIVDRGTYDQWSPGTYFLPVGGAISSSQATITAGMDYGGAWDGVILAQRQPDDRFTVTSVLAHVDSKGVWQLARRSVADVPWATVSTYGFKNGLTYDFGPVASDGSSGTLLQGQDGYLNIVEHFGCAAVDAATGDQIYTAIMGLSPAALAASDYSIEATVAVEPPPSEDTSIGVGVPEGVLSEVPLLGDIGEWFSEQWDRIGSQLTDFLWFLDVWDEVAW